MQIEALEILRKTWWSCWFDDHRHSDARAV